MKELQFWLKELPFWLIKPLPGCSTLSPLSSHVPRKNPINEHGTILFIIVIDQGLGITGYMLTLSALEICSAVSPTTGITFPPPTCKRDITRLSRDIDSEFGTRTKDSERLPYRQLMQNVIRLLGYGTHMSRYKGSGCSNEYRRTLAMFTHC